MWNPCFYFINAIRKRNGWNVRANFGKAVIILINEDTIMYHSLNWLNDYEFLTMLQIIVWSMTMDLIILHSAL